MRLANARREWFSHGAANDMRDNSLTLVSRDLSLPPGHGTSGNLWTDE